MPRIYQSDNDPLDFCSECFPSEPEAQAEYGDEKKTGIGPDGRGNCFSYDTDHPPYEDDSDMYRCHICGRRLREQDNTWIYWISRPPRRYCTGPVSCGKELPPPAPPRHVLDRERGVFVEVWGNDIHEHQCDECSRKEHELLHEIACWNDVLKAIPYKTRWRLRMKDSGNTVDVTYLGVGWNDWHWVRNESDGSVVPFGDIFEDLPDSEENERE